MPTTSTVRKSVLLVEPDPQDLESLRKSFEGLGFDLRDAGSIEDALKLVEEEPPSLILSELILPDGSGFSLCRRLRGQTLSAALPIVLISRWCSEGDRILAFESGADDFVPKPYFARELASRVRAVLRRAQHTEPAPERVVATLDEDFQIRTNTNEVQVGTQRISLTPKEFSVLEALLQYRGRVLSRDELISRVWSHGPSPGERSVDAHVKSLRKKLGLPPSTIETIRGRGYRFSEKPIRTPSIVAASASATA